MIYHKKTTSSSLPLFIQNIKIKIVYDIWTRLHYIEHHAYLEIEIRFVTFCKLEWLCPISKVRL